MITRAYNAIDVLRATISWTLYKKLADADAPRMIWWGEYAKSLEPTWEWEYTLSQEEEFKNRLIAPNRELVRAGLHHAGTGYRWPDMTFLTLGFDVLDRMKHMKRSELDAWAEDRLYGACPWLKP